MTLFNGGSPHLHECKFDGPLKGTHLGQAHIAGTGPKGLTCNQCAHFGLKDKHGRVASPGYYSKSSKDKAGCLKPGKCYAPMPHKANRRFPHSAGACLLFERTDAPFPVILPEGEKP